MWWRGKQTENQFGRLDTSAQAMSSLPMTRFSASLPLEWMLEILHTPNKLSNHRYRKMDCYESYGEGCCCKSFIFSLFGKFRLSELFCNFFTGKITTGGKLVAGLT